MGRRFDRYRTRRHIACATVVAATVTSLVSIATSQGLPALPAHPVATVTPAGLLAQAIPDTTPNAV